MTEHELEAQRQAAAKDAHRGIKDVIRRHGKEITAFAQSVHNTGILCNVAKAANLPGFVEMLEMTLGTALANWKSLGKFSDAACDAALKDIRIHMNMLEADLETIDKFSGEKSGDTAAKNQNG